jgi:hypothetical protein
MIKSSDLGRNTVGYFFHLHSRIGEGKKFNLNKMQIDREHYVLFRNSAALFLTKSWSNGLLSASGGSNETPPEASTLRTPLDWPPIAKQELLRRQGRFRLPASGLEVYV